jgi:cytochrome c biogenesis protein CcdA
MAVKAESAVVLPSLYGIGTALPVVVFAVPIALGTRSVGKLFDKVTTLERWVRWITGGAFIAAGIYFSLVYIFRVTG